MKLFLLRQEGGVVIGTAYVCQNEHTLLARVAEFFAVQDLPSPEDHYPLMGLNLIGATSESEVVIHWVNAFEKYILDSNFRKALNNEIGYINSRLQHSKAASWIFAWLLLQKAID